MSEGKPAKLNIEEKLMACIELAQNRQDDIQALRDERDRLRWALNFVVKTASDPELSFGDRVSVIRHTAQAALTPAGGGHNG